MDKCQTCKYSIFDETWGEYKCTLFSRRIKPEECEQCSEYEKENKKRGNENEKNK